MTIIKMTDKSDPRQSQDHARVVALHRMIPNLITLSAIAAGLTSIQYAVNMQWERATIAILIAMILDGMDGATARLLNAASEFGAQLDSLSDFLAFGVAPSIILYVWVLEESGKLGWIAMLFYTSAVALRLARFNVEKKKFSKWREGFFSGIPSPAGAGLALLPLILWLQEPHFFKQYNYAAPLVSLWMIFVAAMMVSRIPTFSIKTMHIPAKMIVSVMAAAALLIAALVNMPWETLTILGAAYLVSIPFSIVRFKNLEKLNQDSDDAVDIAF